MYMKTNIFSTTVILILLAIVSCKKVPVDPSPVDPVPTDSVSNKSFRILFENLGSYPNVPNKLIALVTIENVLQSSGEINISVPVEFKNQYSTQSISLLKGSYKLKKLILTDSTGLALFASPVTASAKASSVSKPLHLSFTFENKTDQTLAAELLAVKQADTPESFGYPSGSFGNRNPETEMDKFIYIRPIIKVGDIIYDSIPVQLIVKSWDAKNEMTYNIHYLAAGTQGIYLSAKAQRHQLSVSKWGSYDEIILNKNDIQENAVYDIGGEVAAQKLKTVYEFKIVGNTSTALTKTDFSYQPDGAVIQKQVMAKRADMSNYIVQKDLYEYTDGKITTIRSYNESNTLFKTTTVQYSNTNGKIITIAEAGNTVNINAVVNYTLLDTRVGISQDYRIDIQYNYSDGRPASYYSKTMYGGRVLTDLRANSNGSRVEGTYSYDSGINPYAHLAIPDMELTQYTKHNLGVQWKTWYGGYPEHEAYAISYVYGEGGYPKEVTTKYRSYNTKADTYSIRKVFVY